MSQKAIENLRRWKEHPDLFVREVFNVTPDAWQDDVLKAFPTNQRIAMKACKGPGKTAIEAWLAWNFLLTRPYPKIAATSITGDNLADNLWAEMAKWQQKSDILRATFTWTKTRIFCNESPETWFMSARPWSKSANREEQGNTLAGLHADYILFILDESGGIPESVMASAEAALSSCIEGHLVQAGNPTHLEGPLYRACTNERRLWHVTEITADPDDPKRTPRVSIEWARNQIEKYGRDNPYVLVNVFGKFPPSSLNTLLGPDEVQAAMNRMLPNDAWKFSGRRLGVDVARFGDDMTVLFPRQGLLADYPVVMRNARSEDIAAKIAFTWEAQEIDDCLIDDTGGWSAGTIDLLNRTKYAVHPINFSSRAMDDRYFNRRSEMYFMMAEWIKSGAALPNIPELAAELTAPTYWFDKGKLRLEEKDQIKARLGRSPDYADALAVSFALPQPIKGVRLPKEGTHTSHYNPLDKTYIKDDFGGHKSNYTFDPRKG